VTLAFVTLAVGSPPFEVVAPLPVARGGRMLSQAGFSSTDKGWGRGGGGSGAGGGGMWEGLTAPLEDYELFLRRELEVGLSTSRLQCTHSLKAAPVFNP
jgi:hypothetical protein